MATTRPFSYNPPPTPPITGTMNVGTLCIGVSPLAYSAKPGGLDWWMGPDEDNSYVIAKDVSAGNFPTELGSIGNVQFWRSTNTDEAFRGLVQTISSTSQASASAASAWLLTNGYWTSWSLDIVTSGLIVYYDPSNSSSYPGTGTTLTDLSGNGINGVMSSTGVIQNKMMTYNGTSSQVSIADNALLEPGTGDWTIEAWVYYSVITGSTRTFISKTNNGGGSGDWSYGLRTLGNGATRFEVGDGTTSVNSPSYTVSLGQWYQIVGVWTNVASNSIALYVNGTSQGSNSHSFTSVKNSTNPLYLGNYNGGEYSQWFNGRMGVVRMYNKALSSVEILQNFNANKYLYGL